MMFSKSDFEIKSSDELIEFLPVAIFLALVAPLLIAAYTLGFVMDIAGWLKTRS